LSGKDQLELRHTLNQKANLMTTIPIRRAQVCRYCPEGTGIIWNPKDAIRTAEGDIKCLKCVETDTRKVMIRVLGPDHPKNKDFLSSSRTKEG
jgi:hypothetical protein